ncbi:hypothetical protein [Domibacillus epiphyticus]|uniref:hypothetical protein n=1 Tax=Domibacillus epiphyticus TaxID=1714355 RepID=UPI0013010A15|nr:hypothetical protein [Domibacillus epiphyticus]
MGPLTVFALFVMILFVGFFLVYFLRGTLDSSDSHRIDSLPDNPHVFSDKRDPFPDEKL